MSNETITEPLPVFVGPNDHLRLRPLLQPSGPSGPDVLVSILMPCCGQLEQTRLSVPRLLRYSRAPFELICVDVGSLDGTPDYLAGVAAAAAVRVEVVRAAEEAAFASAVAEGLARARGAFVAWVNNDVLVPAMWLQHLVGLASSNPVIGMVGPMSNIAPVQQCVVVPYRLRRRTAAEGMVETEAVDRFAQEQREKHTREWFEAERLGGFCFVIKREVLALAPLLDDRAGAGVFDAEALSLRVQRAGYRLAGCLDLFVHHFGSGINGS
jgi:GT2 family glycosyltransferase